MALLSENEFLIRAKVSLGDLGFYDERLAMVQFGVSWKVAEAYSQELNTPIDGVGKIYHIKPHKLEDEIVIYGHESGPEVFLIPLASFLAGSIASGVVGNLAYDILKDLHQKACEALNNLVKEHSRIYPLTGMINDEALANLIQIKLITPDGVIRVQFSEDKGLPPEIVQFLTRRIEQYKKTYPSRDISDVE